MELQINKENFLSGFVKLQNVENRKAKERSEGFRYLHDMTTKRLAKGREFKIEDLDFSKFTYDDLNEYLKYYEQILSPRLDAANQLFGIIRQAGSVFSPDRRYF